MTITNGTVSYERNVRVADFENKKASVTLSFNVAEGSDPEIVSDQVLAVAVRQVHHRLGLAAPTPEFIKEQADKGKKRQPKAPPAEVPVADPTTVEPASVVETAPAATVSDDPAAISSEPEALVYTDKDMQLVIHAAMAANRSLGKNINEVTLSFTGVPGKSYSTLPQEQRAEWIARVKALYNA